MVILSLGPLARGRYVEAHPEPSHVKLIGGQDGCRYRFAEVGEAPDFLVPIRVFEAQEILKK